MASPMKTDSPAKPAAEGSETTSETTTTSTSASTTTEAPKKAEDLVVPAKKLVKEWFYLDVKPKNQGMADQEIGPFSLNDISELMAEGVLNLKSKLKRGTLEPNKDEEYKEITEHDDFKEIVLLRKLAQRERWYYEDEYRKMQGPISIGELLFKYTEGLLHEKTLVRKKGVAGWKNITECEKEGLFAGVDLDEFLDLDNWYYEDPLTKEEQGPIPAKEVLLRFETKIFTKESKVRREEMEELRELGTLVELLEAGKERAEENENKPVDEFDKFYYEDKYRKIHGPVPFQSVLDLEHEKELNLDSRVKKDNMEEWMDLCDAKLFFTTPKQKRKIKRRKRKRKVGWKAIKTKNNLYVSNLPADITAEEMCEIFGKCGIVKKGPNGKPKVKLYKDKEGKNKGDGLVSYLQPQSVNLATKLLDGKEVRGKIIKCQLAEFKCKGDYQANKRRKLTDREKKVMRQLNNFKSQLLSWDDDENKVAPQLRIVVVYGMFTLEEVNASGNPESFYSTLEDEIGREFQRVGGAIDKMTIFEGNCDGVVAVKYKQPAGAKKCLEVMSGRFFAGRQLKAEYWDGVTNFKVLDTETDEDRIKRFGEEICGTTTDEKTTTGTTSESMETS